MRHLIVLNKFHQEKGFNLIELLVIVIIIGVTAGLGAPSLVGARRQDIANQAFNSVKGALTEAQVNANRLSATCTVTVGADGVSAVANPLTNSDGETNRCLLQSINYDSDVVSVTANSFRSEDLPSVIKYDFTIKLQGLQQTIWIARKDFNGNPIKDTAKCIVISRFMIRTGVIIDPNGLPDSTNCRNPENDRYRP